jgi:hypothetical protein
MPLARKSPSAASAPRVSHAASLTATISLSYPTQVIGFEKCALGLAGEQYPIPTPLGEQYEDNWQFEK